MATILAHMSIWEAVKVHYVTIQYYLTRNVTLCNIYYATKTYH